MKTPDRIVELLYDRPGGWWALEELARAGRLKPDRLDAVLAELGRRGHRLEFSPATGVRLPRPTTLDAHLIERHLGTRRIGRHVICFGELDSTNDTASASARQAGSDGLVVLAESQRAGRGRHGRRWLSPPGQNVLMSILLKDPASRLSPGAVTILAGLAVAEGIERAAPLECQLKWPNDVLIHDRKVCGVLVERRGPSANPHLVVGIGLNANACPATAQVDQPATSLAQQTGAPVERVELVRQLLGRLDYWIGWLLEESPAAMDALRKAWLVRCRMLNQRVSILLGGRVHTGRVMDIDPLTGLVLLTDEGLQCRLPAEGASVV